MTNKNILKYIKTNSVTADAVKLHRNHIEKGIAREKKGLKAKNWRWVGPNIKKVRKREILKEFKRENENKSLFSKKWTKMRLFRWKRDYSGIRI